MFCVLPFIVAASCLADIDGNNTVGVGDILEIIDQWGWLGRVRVIN